MFDTAFPFYPLCIFLSFVLGSALIAYNLRAFSLTREERIVFLVLLCASAIVCGKSFTLVSYLLAADHTHSAHFLDIGLSSYGGVLGFFLASAVFLRLLTRRQTIVHSSTPPTPHALFSALLPAALLIYSVGKIGCFLVGCCYGMNYSGPFAAVYNFSSSAPVGVSLFPVQIVESVVFFLLFCVSELLYKKFPKQYHLCALIFLAALAKFLLDYLRTGHTSLLALSLNQIVSLLVMILAAAYNFLRPINLLRHHQSRQSVRKH